MADKVVNVKMSEECHSILKSYAAFVGRTMSEVLYDFAKQELHQEALYCRAVHSQITAKHRDLDKRVLKPCWGFKCYSCVHEAKCRVGQYDGYFQLKPEYSGLLREGAEWVADLDGTEWPLGRLFK